MRPNKLLGQHFLKSARSLEAMLNAAKNEPATETVLEIGPGRGILTKILAKKFTRVIAIEKDRRLAEELKRILEIDKIKNCKIIAGDILKTDFLKLLGKNPYAVIANIPYYITGRLIRTLLEAKHQPAYIILMVQLEVAERIAARPPKMNLLALSVNVYGKPKIVGRVSKKEFMPEPKVDSAIIRISNISRRIFNENKIDEENFFVLAKTGFSHKRKKLVNTLARFFGTKKNAEEKIKAAGITPNARPQELNLTEWIKLLRT